MTPTTIAIVAAICAPILTFIAGVYATRQKAKADHADDRRDDAKAIDERWQAINEAQRQMMTEQRADFAQIRTELDTVKREVAEVRSELNIVRRVKDAAVDYARQLLTWARLVAPHETPPPVPALLTNEV